MGKIFENIPSISKIFGLILIAVGAAGLGVMSNWFAERGPYLAYSAKFSAATGFSTVGATLDVAVAGAVIVLLGGVIAEVAAWQGNRARLVFILGLAVAFVGGIVQIAAGVIVSTHPIFDLIGPGSYLPSSTRPVHEIFNPVPTPDQQKVSLFGLAIWEKCCYGNNWHKQVPFESCDKPCPSETSGKFLDERIFIFKDNLPLEQLCTCVQDNFKTTYQSMLDIINEDACIEFTQLRVRFDRTLAIPTTRERGFALTLGMLKDQFYRNIAITVSPLVGFPLSSKEDPTGETAEGDGFGCGLGYPKGVMWYQEIYHDQVIKPAGSAALGLGAAALAIVIIEFLLGWFLSKDDSDFGDGKWEGTLAASWNQPAGGAPAQSGQVANSYNGGEAPLAAYQQQDLSSDLLKFYAKYDPTKTHADVEKILAWGKQNGITALNKKLRDKYGADLTGAASGADGGPPV